MGRRKWKQYQETLMRTQLNSDQFVASIEDNNIELKKELDRFKYGEFIEISKTTNTTATIETPNLEENHRKNIDKNISQQKEQEHEESIKEPQELIEEKGDKTEENKHHLPKETNKEGVEEDKKDKKQEETGNFFLENQKMHFSCIKNNLI